MGTDAIRGELVTMRKTYQSTTVNAPIDEVWARLRNFHDMSWAPAVVEQCEAVGDKAGDQIGAGRVLNGVFHETLRELDDSEHVVKYSIDAGPPPVSPDEVKDYIGVIRARPLTDTGGTFVEWSSSWEAADGKAEEFCHNIYVALLNELKKAFA
jgi:hypothetical protein